MKRFKDYPEYSNYKSMIDRCRPSAHSSKNYADKGIRVCTKWAQNGGFLIFLSDMGKKPSPLHTIDRIDSTKGYFKENCRWATMLQQGNNTSRNKRITFGGKSLTYSEWAREIGVSRHTIRSRVLAGWPLGHIVSTPANHGNKWLKLND